jgi:uncharacterized protein (DUF362 family)
MSKVAKVRFQDYRTSVFAALELIEAKKVIKHQLRIIIKPNLVLTSPPPCTTDVRCVEAVVEYCKTYAPQASIVIAEGAGGCKTWDAFEKLGYVELANKYNIELIDIDQDDTILLKNSQASELTELHFPVSIQEGVLITVPVLKDHSITTTTIALKNQIGLMPEKYYSGYWTYKKSRIHQLDEHKAIVDLNLYRPPAISVVDAVIGQKECHLSGPPCDPPKDLILASLDPVAVDVIGSEILGWKWEDIPYIRYANGVIGSAEDIEIVP